jgi:hypothetical protein
VLELWQRALLSTATAAPVFLKLPLSSPPATL